MFNVNKLFLWREQPSSSGKFLPSSLKSRKKSCERDIKKKRRWIEVLKKMMHHHVFMLFPISGGHGRVSVRECVSSVSFGPLWNVYAKCFDVGEDYFVRFLCACVGFTKMLTLSLGSMESRGVIITQHSHQ